MTQAQIAGMVLALIGLVGLAIAAWLNWQDKH